MGFHIADLHGAGLGPQKYGVVIRKIEGIGTVPGGVAFLNVQPGEVVVRQLNLRPFHHLIAKADKHVLDLLQDLIHGMLVANCHSGTGNCDIHSFGS